MTKLPIPDDALDSDTAILGRKGGGKTYTSKAIVERLLDLGRRVCVLDPLGVWAGLRTGADGTSSGYPVAIFGGAHADLPLELSAAEAIAGVLARENVPAVIDLSEISKSAQTAFLAAFLHEFRRVNTEAITLVLEEADVFAPQNPMPDQRGLLGEIDWIARRGRFRGFRLISICQRPARLHKDVLTQCATLIAHRLPAPQDRAAVGAWVDACGDAGKAKEVDETLPFLKVGESWVWAPEHNILKRAMWPAIKTLDTSATPKAGEKRIAPKTLAQVDLSAIKAALASVSPPKERAKKGSDGKVNESVNAETSDFAAQIEAAEKRALARGHARGYVAGMFYASKLIEEAAAEYDANVTPVSFFPTTNEAAKSDAPTSVQKAHKSPPPQNAKRGVMNGAAEKMLAVLDTNPPVSQSWLQVATLAGLKARGGHFNSGRKALIESGVIAVEGDLVRIAKPSKGAGPAIVDRDALVEKWASVLSGGAPRILRAIASVKRTPRHKANIAQELGLEPRGGHWNSAWKQLRDNKLIVDDGTFVRLSDVFDGK